MLMPVVLGLFGLIVGSFLNVLILRWGERPLTGRSSCETCGTTLAWYDLVPIFSWLILAGRCRVCKNRISFQYPLVEATTALLFAFIGSIPAEVRAWVLILDLCIIALLVAIFVYDLYHTVIPDAWVYAFIALAFIRMLIFTHPLDSDVPLWLVFLGGPIAALPLFTLWLVSQGRWMGFGDVKLAVGIGWLLPPVYGVVAIFFAFMIGALVSAPLLFFSSSLWKRLSTSYPFLHRMLGGRGSAGYTMKSEVPFGPFLIVATCIVWFSNMLGISLVAF